MAEPRRTRGGGRLRRAVAGVSVAVGMTATMVTGWAAPASAHAQLERTEPSAGETAATSPARIELRFGEPVEATLGGIRVFDGAGHRVVTGATSHPDGPASLAVALPTLGDGGYVVTWRVTSADAHPVQGAFTFRVGAAAAAVGDEVAASLLARTRSSAAVGAAFAATRAIAFAALLVLIGSVALVVLAWPAGRRSTPLRSLVLGATAALAVATAGGIVLQGAYAGGLPFLSAVRPAVLADVLATRLGRAYAARLLLLVVAAPSLLVLLRPPGAPADAPSDTDPADGGVPILDLPGWWRPLAGATALGLLLTAALAGHATTGLVVPLALVADLLHVGAAALWLGGLATLVAAVLPRRRGAELRHAVTRFSKVAAWAVGVLVASGVFQGWRQVGSVANLTSTPYGTLLLVKTAGVGGLVALGWLSRQAVHRRWRRRPARVAGMAPAVLSTGPGAARRHPDAAVTSRLRRTVGLEVALAVAVVSVTALLVNAAPARAVAAAPVSTTMRSADALVDLTLSPGRAGPSDLHLYTLTPAGQGIDAAEVTARLSLPSRQIPPVTVPVHRITANHWAAYGFDIPIRGAWQLEVIVRTTDVDQVRLDQTLQIR